MVINQEKTIPHIYRNKYRRDSNSASSTSGSSSIGIDVDTLIAEINSLASICHQHNNMSLLDILDADDDNYVYLKRLINEKIKAGYADEANGLTDEYYATLKGLLNDLYLSKTSADTAQGLINFLQGITVGDGTRGINPQGIATLQQIIISGLSKLLGGASFGDYISGIQGAWIGANGDAELQNLIVNRALSVTEFIKNRVSVNKGAQIISAGGGLKIKSFVANSGGNWTVTPTLKAGEEISFKEGDILYANWDDVNEQTGAYHGFREMKFRCGTVDTTNKTFVLIPRDTNAVPHEEMILAMRGSFTNDDRQDYILIESRNGKSNITFFEGANTWDTEAGQEKSWFGKKANRTVAGVDASKYSAVLQNVLFSGLLLQVDEITGTQIRVPIDMGAWVATENSEPKKYGYYSRVSHNGCLWLCVAEPYTTVEPSEETADWQKQVASGDGITSSGEWSHTKTPYKVNTIVTLYKKAFISKKATSAPPIKLITTSDGKYKLSVIDGKSYYTAYIKDGATINNSEDWDVLLNIEGITNGKDGTSILFLGSYSAAPADPSEGWAYYNTSTKRSYTYSDGQWRIMAIDGKDGTDHEWIFCRTKTNASPTIPASQDVDNYVPEGWTADKVGCSDEWPYEWTCRRDKANGVWGSFSAVSLSSNWGYKGDTGEVGLVNKGEWNHTSLPMPATSMVTMLGYTLYAKVSTSVPPFKLITTSDGTYKAAKVNGQYYYTAYIKDGKPVLNSDYWQVMTEPAAQQCTYQIESPVQSVSINKFGFISPSAVQFTCKRIIGDRIEEYPLFLACRKYKDGVWSSHVVNSTASKYINVTMVEGYTSFSVRAYATLADAQSWNDNFFASNGLSVTVDGLDGADGADGVDGAPGADGKDGKDGVDGTDGTNGRDGSMIRPCGLFTEGESYVWNATWRDVVIYTFDNVSYTFAVKNYGATVTVAPTSATGDSNWEAANKFKFIATELLLANKITADMIDVDSLTVKKLATDSGKCTINNDGSITASDAKITGEIVVKTMYSPFQQYIMGDTLAQGSTINPTTMGCNLSIYAVGSSVYYLYLPSATTYSGCVIRIFCPRMSRMDSITTIKCNEGFWVAGSYSANKKTFLPNSNSIIEFTAVSGHYGNYWAISDPSKGTLSD